MFIRLLRLYLYFSLNFILLLPPCFGADCPYFLDQLGNFENPQSSDDLFNEQTRLNLFHRVLKDHGVRLIVLEDPKTKNRYLLMSRDSILKSNPQDFNRLYAQALGFPENLSYELDQDLQAAISKYRYYQEDSSLPAVKTTTITKDRFRRNLKKIPFLKIRDASLPIDLTLVIPLLSKADAAVALSKAFEVETQRIASLPPDNLQTITELNLILEELSYASKPELPLNWLRKWRNLINRLKTDPPFLETVMQFPPPEYLLHWEDHGGHFLTNEQKTLLKDVLKLLQKPLVMPGAVNQNLAPASKPSVVLDLGINPADRAISVKQIARLLRDRNADDLQKIQSRLQFHPQSGTSLPKVFNLDTDKYIPRLLIQLANGQYLDRDENFRSKEIPHLYFGRTKDNWLVIALPKTDGKVVILGIVRYLAMNRNLLAEMEMRARQIH